MKRVAWSITAIIVLAPIAVFGQARNTFASGELGFSIEAPSIPESDNQSDTIAMFFMPVSNDFAANVGIIKQKYRDSIEAYDKLSLGQFRILKHAIVNRRLSNNEAMYEYKGLAQGKEMHFYARAIKTSQYIYLATATSLESSVM